MKRPPFPSIAFAIAVFLAIVVLPNEAATAAGWPTSWTNCGARILKSDGSAWQCRFSDDFSGYAVDSKKWSLFTTAATGLHGNGDCWLANSSNVSVLNGTLRIATRKEASPFTCKVSDGTSYQTQYSSGGVSTSGKFNQAFGRFEFRAKFPAGAFRGIQTSVWMHPTSTSYGSWPASGEIDVAEYYSAYPDRVIPYIHYNTATSDSTVTNTRCMVSDPWNFHTYVAEWTSARIRISIDGTTCIDHAINPAAPLTGSQPFDKPFSIHISQGLGGSGNNLDPAFPLPAVTQVDWVRVWS